ncbi:MarR family winged helix-turn-helix transcriptional regulator [Cryptosporangium aurantiacum]|uniref:Transcriptional regulator, MarR family n=1 Tax=Cryptosporangium aurantiacum TaxID=134849 RepID=A0A1M7QF04_9ACTN|nr:MarR family transcriptional regulator [Cryptosporangium aurantiacum]SHN29578.1 transcriptional regulator, MarR family [Cryptosporangium aurantiacum]
MTSPRWLDADEQRAWRRFLRMQAELTARLARQLQTESDLSLADFEVLVNLTDVPEGRMRVTELAKLLQWEKSRLSHHFSRMEKRGLVVRENCPSDARGAFVVLTPEGRSAIEAAAPGHVETVRRLMFDGLTSEQVAALTAIANVVLTRIERDATGEPAPADV